MRTLDRYIFREVLQAWFAVTFVLLVILMSTQLAAVLSGPGSSQYTGGMVLRLLWLSSLPQFTILVPVGLFLAVMLALGRLYHESELAAMMACGLGLRRLLKPVFLLAVMAAALLAWLVFSIVPDGLSQREDIRYQAVREARFASLQPGRFRSFGTGNVVFYAESVDEQGVLHNVYAQRNVNGKLDIVTAKRAEQRGAGDAEQTFVLYDGERYEGVPGTAQFRIIRFVEHGIPVHLPQVATGRQRLDSIPTMTLLQSGELEKRAEFEWRLATPVSILLLAICAVPLAQLRPRQGAYAKFGHFILLYFLYMNLLATARTWMERGTMPPALGMWWVHGAIAVFALFLWWRSSTMNPPLLSYVWRWRHA